MAWPSGSRMYAGGPDSTRPSCRALAVRLPGAFARRSACSSCCSSRSRRACCCCELLEPEGVLVDLGVDHQDAEHPADHQHQDQRHERRPGHPDRRRRRHPQPGAAAAWRCGRLRSAGRSAAVPWVGNSRAPRARASPSRRRDRLPYVLPRVCARRRGPAPRPRCALPVPRDRRLPRPSRLSTFMFPPPPRPSLPSGSAPAAAPDRGTPSPVGASPSPGGGTVRGRSAPAGLASGSSAFRCPQPHRGGPRVRGDLRLPGQLRAPAEQPERRPGTRAVRPGGRSGPAADPVGERLLGEPVLQRVVGQDHHAAAHVERVQSGRQRRLQRCQLSVYLDP